MTPPSREDVEHYQQKLTEAEAVCRGRQEVNGRNHDDPRWVPRTHCKGSGVSEALRAALGQERQER